MPQVVSNLPSLASNLNIQLLGVSFSGEPGSSESYTPPASQSSYSPATPQSVTGLTSHEGSLEQSDFSNNPSLASILNILWPSFLSSGGPGSSESYTPPASQSSYSPATPQSVTGLTSHEGSLEQSDFSNNPSLASILNIPLPSVLSSGGPDFWESYTSPASQSSYSPATPQSVTGLTSHEGSLGQSVFSNNPSPASILNIPWPSFLSSEGPGFGESYTPPASQSSYSPATPHSVTGSQFPDLPPHIYNQLPIFADLLNMRSSGSRSSSEDPFHK